MSAMSIPTVNTPHMGRFITFEGGEGSGKSTRSRALVKAINDADLGFTAVGTREPGGTDTAEKLRDIILSSDKEKLAPKAESLLFYAARIDHINKVINPALARGDWVICDRFFDSTTAYQMAASGVEREWLDQLRYLCLKDYQPDLTFIIDLPVDVAQKRVEKRLSEKNSATPVDRFEGEGRQFHEDVRQAFLDIAKQEKKRCVLLDGNLGEQALDTLIHNHLKAHYAIDLGGRYE